MVETLTATGPAKGMFKRGDSRL